MSAIPLIVTGLGTTLNVAGNVTAGQARADAAAKDAQAKRQQADELERRAGFAEEDIRRSAKEFVGAQREAFGYTGFASDSVALLSELERTNAAAERQVSAMRRDTAFRASQLRAGANVSDELASGYSTTGWLSAAGAAIGGGYRFGDAAGWWTPKAAPESLKSRGPAMMSGPFRPFGEDLSYNGSIL